MTSGNKQLPSLLILVLIVKVQLPFQGDLEEPGQIPTFMVLMLNGDKMINPRRKKPNLSSSQILITLLS